MHEVITEWGFVTKFSHCIRSIGSFDCHYLQLNCLLSADGNAEKQLRRNIR